LVKMEDIGKTFKELTTSIEGEIERLTLEKRDLDSQVRKLVHERDNPKNYDTERILLDIGGLHYATSLSTLTSVPGSYFYNLFTGTIPDDMMSSDGRLFIDRDGGLFRYILNCLRDPNRFILKLRGKQELDDLREEAIFYGIENLVFANSVFVPDVQNWLDETKIVLKEYSTQHSESYPASNVLNYSRTYWLSLPGTLTDQWLVFDFTKEVFLSKVAVKVDNYECTVKDFSIQYSENDDAKSWVTLKDFQAKVGNQCTDDQYFEGFEFRGRYMRFFCKNNWGPGGGNFILITNIKFFGAFVDG